MSELTLNVNTPSEIIIRIEPDGRIFWRGREVVSDDEFKKAMIDLRDAICGKAGTRKWVDPDRNRVFADHKTECGRWLPEWDDEFIFFPFCGKKIEVVG